MFEVRKPTKKLKEICSQLGEPYVIKVIDYENTIYHTFGNYELEVSGLNNNKKSFDATIYVHTITPSERVETISNIYSISSLADKLNELIYKYSH